MTRFQLRFTVATLFAALSARAEYWKEDYTFAPTFEGSRGYAFPKVTVAAAPHGGVFVSTDYAVNGALTHGAPRLLKPDGTVNYGFHVLDTGVSVAAVYADGRVVLAKELGTTQHSQPRLQRYLADGSVDSAFSAAAFDGPASVQLLTDGRILVYGSFSTVNGAAMPIVALLNADGSVASGFHSPFSSDVSHATGVAITSNGDLVVGGYFANIGAHGASFVQLKLDGTLNDAFSNQAELTISTADAIFRGANGGIVYVPNGGKPLAYAATGARDATYTAATVGTPQSYGPQLSDGRIFYVTRNGDALELRRLNTDGTADSTFVVSGTSDYYFGVHTPVIADDGTFYDPSALTRDRVDNNLLVTRLKSDGTIDNAFTARIGYEGGASLLLALPDGKVVVKTSALYNNGVARVGDSQLLRLNADGSTDATFHASPSSVYRMAATASGKILLAGGAIVRLNPDGSQESGYSYSGDIGSVGIDSADAVYVTALNGSRGIVRLLPTTGSVDPTFAATITDVFDPVVPLPDGSVMVHNAQGLICLRHDGSIDPTLTLTNSAMGSDLVGAVALPDNSVVTIAATGLDVSNGPFTIARFSRQGALLFKYVSPKKSGAFDYLGVGAVISDLLRQAAPTGYTLLPVRVRYFDLAVDTKGTLFLLSGVQPHKYLRAGDASFDPTAGFIQPGYPAPTNRVTEGNTLTLTSLSYGVYPLTYQWYRDGKPVAGATDATLAIAHARGTDSGDYTTTVTNAYGTATSLVQRILVETLPQISTQPFTQTAYLGQPVTLSVVAAGSDRSTFQWYKNGVAISGANQAELTFENITLADAADYTVKVTDVAGTTTSSSATLTVKTPTAPVITRQPPSQTFSRHVENFRIWPLYLSVSAAGDLPLTYAWSKDGVAIPGATGAVYQNNAPGPADSGLYTVTVTNASGSIVSDGALMIVSDGPTIRTEPTSQTVPPNTDVTFHVTANQFSPSYQWKRNGQPIPGQTNSALLLSQVQSDAMGFYSCAVSDGVGTSESRIVTLCVLDGAPSRAANISARARVTPNEALTDGFVLPASKTLLVRAVGPTLTAFGLEGVLADPQLEIIPLGASTPVAANDNWSDAPTAADVRDAGARLGAFGLKNGSKDAALVVTLPAGQYTARVTGADGGSGIAIVEIYDADASDAAAQLINLSARADAGIGDNALVPGFVVTGTAPRQMLIRAVGPTLRAFGVGNALADPKLAVIPLGKSYVVAQNDNWCGDPRIKAAMKIAGAFGLADNSNDAAVLVRLPPGGYSVVTSGVAGTTGTAIVEVYDLGP